MKNFQDFLVDKEQVVSDPFKYTTPQVQSEMVNATNAKVTKLMLATSIAHIITAPFQTIVSSMQLSVLPHKDIFVSTQSRTKQLARLNTQLTVAQKRNLQLMIRSGGQFQPYTAPVYTGYQQCVKNLAKQGWKAFFKGLGFRLIHNLPHVLCYGAFFKFLAQSQTKFFGFTQLVLKCFVFQSVTDMTLNVFHVLENRYILQNNIKEFRGNPYIQYLAQVLSKIITRGQLFNGLSYHAINVGMELFLKFPALLILMLSQRFDQTTASLYFLSQFLMYPFSTAYKRFVCQSTTIPGMIPIRYSSIGHAIKVIAFQQKAKGLWRGFGLHTLNIAIRLSILQFIFQNVEITQKEEF